MGTDLLLGLRVWGQRKKLPAFNSLKVFYSGPTPDKDKRGRRD